MIHLVQLGVKLNLKLFLLLLFLLEVLPELPLECINVFLGQLEELFGGDLLLLVKVAPEFKLMLNLGNRVFDVLIDTLDLVDLLVGNVLEHLKLVVLVMLETVGAKVHTVLKTLVHEDKLMFGAVVADLSLINLSGNTIEDLSADLRPSCVRDAVIRSQQTRLIIRELIQVFLCKLWVRVDQSG